jgi:hypothetical protein
MDLEEMEREDVVWIHVAEDRVQWKTGVNTALDLRVLRRRTVYFCHRTLIYFTLITRIDL